MHDKGSLEVALPPTSSLDDRYWMSFMLNTCRARYVLAGCPTYMQPDCTPDIVSDVYTEMSLRQLIKQLDGLYFFPPSSTHLPAVCFNMSPRVPVTVPPTISVVVIGDGQYSSFMHLKWYISDCFELDNRSRTLTPENYRYAYPSSVWGVRQVSKCNLFSKPFSFPGVTNRNCFIWRTRCEE